jgi:hypothetical protein
MPDNQTFDIRFLGLAQRKSRYAGQPGECTLATNVAWDKLGQLTKRPGNVLQAGSVVTDKPSPATRIGPATVQAPTFGMLQYNESELKLASTNRLYASNPGGPNWISRDYVAEAVGTRRPLQTSSQSNNQNYNNPDCIVCNGVEVWAWEVTAGAPKSPTNVQVFTAVYEVATGAIILQPTVVTGVSGGYRPKLTVVGANVVVLTYCDLAGNVYARSMTCGVYPPSWGAEHTLLGSGMDTPVVYDVTTIVGDTTHFVVALAGAVGGIFVHLVTLSSFATAASALISTGTTGAVSCVTVQGTAGQTLYVAWAEWNATVGTSVQPPDSAWVVTTGTYNAAVYAHGLNPSSLATTFATYAVWNITLPVYSATDAFGGGVPLEITDWFVPQITLAPLSSTREAVIWNCPTYAGPIIQGSVNAYVDAQIEGQILYVQNITSAGANTGALMTTFGVELSSRAAQIGTKSYVLAHAPSTTQGTYFLLDLNTDFGGTAANVDYWARPVCALANRLASTSPNLSNVPPKATDMRSQSDLANLALYETGIYIAPISVVAGDSLVGEYRVWRAQLDFTHPNRGRGGALGHSLVLGSQFYDGQQATELGHYLYPENTAGQPTGSSGGAGTIGYIAIYVWTTASGETIRSTCNMAPLQKVSGNFSPSQAYVLNASAGTSASFYFAPPGISTKSDGENGTTTNVGIEVYRTTLNGDTFYLVTTLLAPPQFGYFAWSDGSTDAQIVTNPVLYFVPGGGALLENVSPPCFAHTIVHGGRVWGIGDDLRTLWYSKQYTDGEQPGFNEELTLQVEDGSDVVALASMDEKLLIGTQRYWYVVYGSGPDDGGNGNDLTYPQRLLFEQTPTNLLSLAEIPSGIVFQAANNQVYLIDRSLNCTWFSDRVEDLLNSYPVITACNYFGARHELRIACNSADGTNGIELVYNVFADAWTVFAKLATSGSGLGNAYPTACAQVVTLNGVEAYHWDAAVGGQSAGGIFVENAVTGSNVPAFAWCDGTSSVHTFVVSDVELQWINLQQVTGGYSRVRTIVTVGDWFDYHQLNVQYGSGYNTAYSGPTGQATLFADGGVGPTVLANVSPEELRLTLTSQVSHAFRVRLTDAAPATFAKTSGQGCSFAAISINYDTETGVGKFLAAAQGT